VTINKTHDLLLFLLRKYQGGYLSHEEIDSVLDRAQIEYFDEIKPAFGLNQQMHDALLPFKSEYVFTNVSSPSGVISLPSDYYHLLSIETVVMESSNTLYIGVPLVGEDELADRRTSQLIPLTTKTTVARLKAGNLLQLYPKQVNAGTIYYLKRPATPVYAYTGSGRSAAYDSAGATHLEWNEPTVENIIWKALKMLGVNTQDAGIIQMAQAKEAVA
jgi:hypothetical protein